MDQTDAGKTYIFNKVESPQEHGLTPEMKEYGLFQPPSGAAIAGMNGTVGKADKFCRDCGAKLIENARFCSECGKEIEKDIDKNIEKDIKIDISKKGRVLLACSYYASTNPPKNEGANIYEYTDTELIFEYYCNGQTKLRYISADVIASANEIIKKYGIDKWRDYEHTVNGMMGGSVSVMYRDGNELVGSSMDRMGSAVYGAYSELMQLFNRSE